MNDIVRPDYEKMYADQKAYCAELQKEIDLLRTRIKQMSLQNEDKADKIKHFREQVKFLEGQIDAFQYCMSCRR